jgi:hypothetical protein
LNKERNRGRWQSCQRPLTFVPATVLPVSAAAALQWARGDLHDRELILSAPLVPEAIFVVDLPDIHAWRGCLVQCVALWQAGAATLIARTGNPIVIRYMLARGCLPTLIEHTRPEKTRYIAPPAALSAWMFGIAQYSAAASGVTNSR